MGRSSQRDSKHSSFDFATQLQFEAGSNLHRSRSDTSIIRSNKSSNYSFHQQSSIVDQWEVPTIDFTLHPQRPVKLWKKEDRQFNGKTSGVQFEKIPVPKVLEKPKEKATSFATTFRMHSAGAARRLVCGSMYRAAGTYKSPGPHAFRGDDFRPNPVEKLQGKPPFITTFTTDAGNLELKRRSISLLNEGSVQSDSLTSKREPPQRKAYHLKPFVTSTKQNPKWEKSLVLQKEKYHQGISGDHTRMNQIVKQLSWCLQNEKTLALDRPDIKDYKTIDWLQVTRHPKQEMTILH